MDRNKITRQRFRHLLVETTDNLPFTFPASPCPYPAGPVGAAGPDISYAGDSTPKGGIPVTGARLQRRLNKAAYEDNVRRGAGGGAMTRALQEVEVQEGMYTCGVFCCECVSLWCVRTEDAGRGAGAGGRDGVRGAGGLVFSCCHLLPFSTLCGTSVFN